MPNPPFSKQLGHLNDVINSHCKETEPKKRRAKIAKILNAKVNPATLNNHAIFTDTNAVITDPMERERRGKMTATLRRHVLEQKMAQGTKKRNFPGMIQRTGNLYYYFKWIGEEEVAEDFDRVMAVSKESREEQILRLRSEGMTKEVAEEATDTQQKQAAIARGNMLKEMASLFKDTTAESLLKTSDEEIVNLYPLISYMMDLSLNLDELYTSQADHILLTDEARKLCQHLSDLQGPLNTVMGRAELIFNPYYQYLDHKNLSAKCQADAEYFAEYFPEYGNNESYLGTYGTMIFQASQQAEPSAPKKDYRDGLREKLTEQAKKYGMSENQLSYKRTDGTTLEDNTTDLGQFLYEGETVLVSDGKKQLEVTFRNGKPLVNRQAIPDGENVAEINGNDPVYVNQHLKAELNKVVQKVRKADPKWMIGSPQYREMREKLNEFAEIYNHLENGLTINNPSIIRKHQKLLCELMTKANTYLRYKGTTSEKTSERKRIRAAQSILEFAKQRLAAVDRMEDENKAAAIEPINVIVEPPVEVKNENIEAQIEPLNEAVEQHVALPQAELKTENIAAPVEPVNVIADPPVEAPTQVKAPQPGGVPQGDAPQIDVPPQAEMKNENIVAQIEPLSEAVEQHVEVPQAEMKTENIEAPVEPVNVIADPPVEAPTQVKAPQPVGVPQGDAPQIDVPPQIEMKSENIVAQIEPLNVIIENPVEISPQVEMKTENIKAPVEPGYRFVEPIYKSIKAPVEPSYRFVEPLYNFVEPPVDVPSQVESDNVNVEPLDEKHLFNEGGRRFIREQCLFRENVNTLELTEQLEDAFADNSKNSVYNRLNLGDRKKFHKKLNVKEKEIVGKLLENAVIRMLLHTEQQNIWWYSQREFVDVPNVYGPYELLTRMHSMEHLRTIVKNTGVIDEELDTITRLDLLEMIEEPLDLRLAHLHNRVFRKSDNKVLENKEKVLAEHKEFGVMVKDDPRNWVRENPIQKPNNPKIQPQIKQK